MLWVDYILITKYRCYNSTMKSSIGQAIVDNKIVHIPSAFAEVPGWDTFYEIFKTADSSNNFATRTFGTFGIDRAETLTDNFDNLISVANESHPQQKVSVLAIIHFLSANDNNIPEEAKNFYNDFRASSTEQVPPGFQQYMIPTRHSDPVDGIFIQCTGKTLWTAYYADSTESFVVHPGDAMFIPKGIEHTVETLEPRTAISIGMA
jgi:mannose-6-phosphate isomerase-like protein (cupin superfamily)